jgi:flagellar protein FlbD
MADLASDGPTDGPTNFQGRTVVILLTRLNGPVFALNPDLIERADCTPDTVITLVDGTKYVVSEPLTELVRLIRQFRASVVAEAQHMESHPAMFRPEEDFTPAAVSVEAEPRPTVVQLHRRER